MIDRTGSRTQRFESLRSAPAPNEQTLVGKVGGLDWRQDTDNQGRPIGIWIVTFTLLEAEPIPKNPNTPKLPPDVPVRIELGDAPPNFTGRAATAHGAYVDNLFQASEVLVPDMGLKLERTKQRVVGIILAVVVLIIIATIFVILWRSVSLR